MAQASSALFDVKPSLSISALNRILQTSLPDQLRSRGNLSETMIEYIDDSKFLLSDNRIPFIRHKTEIESTFLLPMADLPYNGWVGLVDDKLKQTCNVFAPFSIQELADQKSNQTTKVNTPEPNMDTIKPEPLDYDIDDRHTVEMEFNRAKRCKIEDSVALLNNVKKSYRLDYTKRCEALKVLKENMLLERVPELYQTFRIEDGEAIINRLSTEQRDCLNSILHHAFPSHNLAQASTPPPPPPPQHTNSNGPEPFYKIFLIEGSAGCGKSSIIEGLNYHVYKYRMQHVRLCYITQTNVLCQSMASKCSYNPAMQYLTFFSFLNVLDLSFNDKRQLFLNCDALKGDAFQTVCGFDFLANIASIRKNLILPPMDGPEKPHLFVIFDEIYTVSDGKLSLFLYVLRCLKLKYENLQIHCILIGDQYQLQPFTKTEDVKLEVHHVIQGFQLQGKGVSTTTSSSSSSPTPSDRIKHEPGDVSMDEISLQCVIEQSETLGTATKFLLKKQFRIVDDDYTKFVERIRCCGTNEDIGIQVLTEIKDLWPDKYNKYLDIRYPLEEIVETLENIKNKDYQRTVVALSRAEIFKKTIDTTVFCFTNKHAHYYTISLAFNYWNQIENGNRGGHTIDHFLTFALIFKLKEIQTLDPDYNIIKMINNVNYLVNVLPLIRYCPYKMLTFKGPVARLSIVYLLDWTINETREITHVVVYSDDKKSIFSLLPQVFTMNLFKTTLLFGIPLQLAFSSTFASSQGLTLKNKIAISCANISHSELYVCLTRIQRASDLVRIF